MEIGKHNQKLTEIRKAFRQGTLTGDGLLPIEGPTLLEEAQRSQIEIVDVFRRADAAMPPVEADAVFEVPPEVFETIQDTEHSQGVIATVRPRQYTLGDVFSTSPQLIIVLARLQDPGNVGTILRIGEAFEATGCIALRGTVGFYNSKVVRASTGSIFRFPHTGPESLEEAVRSLRSRRIALVGSSPSATRTIEEWEWQTPSAILVGNEGQGLTDEEVALCDTVLRIPHNRTVESLNSAIATAVILYEASRQRR
jgi:RNA methyltransferase, TrmH family